MAEQPIKPGQVWQQDQGGVSRQVHVLGVDGPSPGAGNVSRYDNPYVLVQGARKSRLRANTLRSRYSLVQDAPGGAGPEEAQVEPTATEPAAAEPTATVLWGEGCNVITGRPFTPQRITEVRQYAPPTTAYPNGRALIVGSGDCPLWADTAQITVHPGRQGWAP